MYPSLASVARTAPDFLLTQLVGNPSRRLDFQSRLHVVGHLSDEEWIRLVNQHLRATYTGPYAKQTPGIAEHVLPERWTQAA